MNINTLNNYKNNTFSQFGEDGIIDEILRRLDIQTGTSVEFGAWDGVLFSNTARLWTENNWTGILIEPDLKKYKQLEIICSPYKTIPINVFVKPTGINSIENILTANKINFNDVKLLSIDIDGNEYHILKNLSKLNPPIIIAEYNPTIPPEMEIVSTEDSFFGSSAKALDKLMAEMGYFTVAITESNCFFVKKDFKDRFNDLDTSFSNLFNKTNLTYLITGYNGNYGFSRKPSFGMTLPLKKTNIQIGDFYLERHSHAKIKWNYCKDKIKSYAKKIIKEKVRNIIKGYYSYIIWLLKGKPVPAHGFYKWKILKNLSNRYKIETFIETGTAGGGTVLELQKYFKQLYTIELDPTLFHQGRANIGNNKKIKCLFGDSGKKINDILDELKNPAIFWLDAHYSGSGTARGDKDSPIIEELTSIFENEIDGHIVVIDDAREFTGSNGYPNEEFLSQIISTKAPKYKLIKNNDLFIISNR